MGTTRPATVSDVTSSGRSAPTADRRMRSGSLSLGAPDPGAPELAQLAAELHVLPREPERVVEGVELDVEVVAPADALIGGDVGRVAEEGGLGDLEAEDRSMVDLCAGRSARFHARM